MSSIDILKYRPPKLSYKMLAVLIWIGAVIVALIAVISRGEGWYRAAAAAACPAMIYVGLCMYQEHKQDGPTIYQWSVWCGVLLIFAYALSQALV